MTLSRRTRSESSALDPIEAAAKAIGRGGIIVYPTDTLWGLGASLEHEAAIERVFELKRRPKHEPLSIAVAAVGQIALYAKVTPAARRLFQLLPGPLSLVLEKRRTVPSLVTAGRDHVAIRVPAHRECLRLLAQTGPLTATSANLHGAPDPKTLAEARGVFGNQVDFYLGSLTPPIGSPSTIVDARTDPVQILRVGALSESRIRKILGD